MDLITYAMGMKAGTTRANELVEKGWYTNNAISLITSYAFLSCSALTSIACENVKSIGTNAFLGAYNLSYASFPNCSYITTSMFSDADLTYANFENAIEIGSRAFYSCPTLLSVNLKNCESIGIGAFNCCNKLSGIELLLVAHISSNAFGYCTSITKAYIPNCNSLGSNAFAGCNKLTTASINSSCSIYNSAFYSTSLTSLYLGRPYTTYDLLNANALSATPIASGTGYIYVPSESVSYYKTSTNWSVYSSRITAIPAFNCSVTLTDGGQGGIVSVSEYEGDAIFEDKSSWSGSKDIHSRVVAVYGYHKLESSSTVVPVALSGLSDYSYVEYIADEDHNVLNISTPPIRTGTITVIDGGMHKTIGLKDGCYLAAGLENIILMSNEPGLFNINCTTGHLTFDNAIVKKSNLDTLYIGSIISAGNKYVCEAHANSNNFNLIIESDSLGPWKFNLTLTFTEEFVDNIIFANGYYDQIVAKYNTSQLRYELYYNNTELSIEVKVYDTLNGWGDYEEYGTIEFTTQSLHNPGEKLLKFLSANTYDSVWLRGQVNASKINKNCIPRIESGTEDYCIFKDGINKFSIDPSDNTYLYFDDVVSIYNLNGIQENEDYYGYYDIIADNFSFDAKCDYNYWTMNNEILTDKSAEYTCYFNSYDPELDDSRDFTKVSITKSDSIIKIYYKIDDYSLLVYDSSADGWVDSSCQYFEMYATPNLSDDFIEFIHLNAEPYE